MSNEKKSIKPKIFAIIVAVIAVLIVVSGFLILKNNSNNKDGTPVDTTAVENVDETKSEEKTKGTQSDETSENDLTIVDKNYAANVRFYQIQQYNMQRDLPLSYDENTIYYYRGNTEYGGWVNNTDSIDDIKLDKYASVDDISFKYVETNDLNVSICLSGNRVASSKDYIYYIRDGIIYRTLSDVKEIKNSYMYYDGEELLKFTDEKICDISQYETYQFILSDKYIYVFATEFGSGIIIRMLHDGSEQTVIMSGMYDTDSVPMYTIGNDMYFTYNGELYCNYDNSISSVVVCEIGENIELKEAFDNTLYLHSAELHKSYALHDTYNQVIYKYTPGSDKLVVHTSAIIDGIGDIFVDDDGTVVFACPDEGGTPTYILKNKKVKNGVVLHSDFSSIFVYKNSAYGVDTDRENLVLVHKF